MDNDSEIKLKICKDSSRIEIEIEIPKDNCLKIKRVMSCDIKFFGDVDILNSEYAESDDGESEQENTPCSSYFLPYYCGVICVKKENRNIVIRSKPRFEVCVYDMLSCVCSYIDDSVKTKLFCIDKKNIIDITKIESNDSECIQKEYEVITKKKLENTQKVSGYSINMALLFELYVRYIVQAYINNLDNSNLKMEPYYNKESDKGDNTGYRKILEKEMYIQGKIIPDIILKWNDTNYIIIDAKYKDGDIVKKTNRDDRLQLLAYGYAFNSKHIVHVFPRAAQKCVEISREQEKEEEQKSLYYQCNINKLINVLEDIVYKMNRLQ